MSDEEQTRESARLAHPRVNLEWLLAAGLLILLGVCMMLPPVEAIGARRGLARAAAAPDGRLYLIVGVLYVVLCSAYYFATRSMSEVVELRRKNLLEAIKWVAGFGLLLIFGWYFKDRLATGSGGGFGGRSLDWANRYLGNWAINFWGVIIAYGVIFVVAYLVLPKSAKKKWRLQPDLDWLASYLLLLILGSFLIMGETSSRLNYPIWFAVVGAAFGIVYYVLTRWTTAQEKAITAMPAASRDPNLERWGLAAGLLIGLGISLKNGLRGWANLYIGSENWWTEFFWYYIGAATLGGLLLCGCWLLVRRRPRGFDGDAFPHACTIIWIVLIQQNVIAQLITGKLVLKWSAPPNQSIPLAWNWDEIAFSFYYLFLFAITGFIVYDHNSKGKAQCLR